MKAKSALDAKWLAHRLRHCSEHLRESFEWPARDGLDPSGFLPGVMNGGPMRNSEVRILAVDIKRHADDVSFGDAASRSEGENDIERKLHSESPWGLEEGLRGLRACAGLDESNELVSLLSSENHSA